MELILSKTSRLRALLTECHPFELPFELGSRWLYDWFEQRALNMNNLGIRVQLGSRRDILLAVLLGAEGKLPNFASAENPRRAQFLAKTLSITWRAPASFLVRRDRIRKRSLDLLALGSQVSIAFIYANHKDAILYFGSRSRSSLRYPFRVNSHGKSLHSRFKNRETSPEAIVETSNRQLGTYNSFFVYDKYAFGGQFYDSKRWHALEAHWRYLRRIDISNCFKSIYTHSFAWSTGSDAHSKAHLSSQGLEFDALDLGRAFDKVMQSSNWGETHGICVGPEASRIFAEIIFQKIDLEIGEKLRVAGLRSKDFEILRYVDDYFIYSLDSRHQSLISDAIEATISEYGFSINPIKTRDFVTPFTTSISTKKANLKMFLRQALPAEGELPRFESREVSVHLKSTLIDADNDAAAVGSSLTQVERHLKKFLRKRAARCNSLSEAKELSSYAWSFIHSMLYQYLSHPSVTSAMKVVRTLRFYWLSSDFYSNLSSDDRRVERYRTEERLHFALSRAISRLIEVTGSEVEMSHFLSLACACNITLSASDTLAQNILAKIRLGVSEMRSSKSNQAYIFLLLSSIKYFLKERRVSVEIREEFLKHAQICADRLFSDAFIPGVKIKRHASQEVFLLAVLECPFFSKDEKYRILKQPWVLGIIDQSVTLATGSKTGASRFLRRCIAEEPTDVQKIGLFDWDSNDFDEILYEKEPQFIY